LLTPIKISYFSSKPSVIMDSKSGTSQEIIPELLHHTVLTVVDYSHNASGASRTVFILATHGTHEGAQAYAAQSLEQLNFKADDFQKYEVRGLGSNRSGTSWVYGDGVMVFARSLDGQEFRVSTCATQNNESLRANAEDGKMILPEGAQFLHYVIQTILDYDTDRSGGRQQTEIIGVYLHRADAWAAAHMSLKPEDFVEYDRRGDAEFVEQWPFGENVAVHAIGEWGLNSLVAVTTPPQHKQDIKKHGLRRRA
jgi:hypothetical protein